LGIIRRRRLRPGHEIIRCLYCLAEIKVNGLGDLCCEEEIGTLADVSPWNWHDGLPFCETYYYDAENLLADLYAYRKYNGDEVLYKEVLNEKEMPYLPRDTD
jgi:hypothetical protein